MQITSVMMHSMLPVTCIFKSKSVETSKGEAMTREADGYWERAPMNSLRKGLRAFEMDSSSSRKTAISDTRIHETISCANIK